VVGALHAPAQRQQLFRRLGRRAVPVRRPQPADGFLQFVRLAGVLTLKQPLVRRLARGRLVGFGCLDQRRRGTGQHQGEHGGTG